MRKLKHCFRAAKHLAHDPNLPRWVRWLGSFGLLPIPGPLDELAVMVVALTCLVFYRSALRDSWCLTSCDVVIDCDRRLQRED